VRQAVWRTCRKRVNTTDVVTTRHRTPTRTARTPRLRRRPPSLTIRLIFSDAETIQQRVSATTPLPDARAAAAAKECDGAQQCAENPRDLIYALLQRRL